jgi:hypothetical protein
LGNQVGVDVRTGQRCRGSRWSSQLCLVNRSSSGPMQRVRFNVSYHYLGRFSALSNAVRGNIHLARIPIHDYAPYEPLHVTMKLYPANPIKYREEPPKLRRTRRV